MHNIILTARDSLVRRGVTTLAVSPGAVAYVYECGDLHPLLNTPCDFLAQIGHHAAKRPNQPLPTKIAYKPLHPSPYLIKLLFLLLLN